ncbi:MAG TPA: aspartate dehydrogenase [Casimicrobiaceae bacterium]|nr:aspartate dehydrogenase [Casimicrobiaceae bacterium]
MQLGLLGGGVIARLILEHAARGDLASTRVAGILGRAPNSRASTLAADFDVPFVTRRDALIALEPDVVVEAASHDAVREHAQALLERGISLIVLSAGALCDDALRSRLEAAAVQSGAMLYVPSGGIGGLDALKAACAAGVEHVEIVVAKPSAAWNGIPFVEKLGVDLGRLAGATTLFDGSAREGVPHFPANVNIAAVLAMAGAGFDRTRLKVVADPGLKRNTHTITVRGKTGTISVKLESVPSPDNPKTALLACYSAIAAVKSFRANVRYGT